MSTIPRVTIVVPLISETASFESTLVSVLENRPVGCEVVVAHDGNYRDPFDLSDEVVFTRGESADIVQLIRAGTRVSRARFVHVIAPGLCATNDWMAAALNLFGDPSVGAVAPSVVDAQSGRLVSAGWRDLPGKLCSPIATESNRRPEGRRVQGCFLQASFWRQNVLESVLDAIGPSISDLTAISYAMGQLLAESDWQVRSIAGSQLQLESTLPELEGAVRGRVLSGICRVVSGSSKPTSWLSSLTAALTGRISFGEFVGQRSFSSTAALVAKAIDRKAMVVCGDGNHVLEFPTAQVSSSRRAA